MTVTWNSSDYIIEQINSVHSGCQKISYEQLIADNASSDGTVAKIRQKFPDLYLEQYKINRGFSRATNSLLKQAKGDYILLLNPDMKVLPGTLDTILEYAKQNPTAGVIGCRLIDQDGNFNSRTAPRRFPHLRDQLVILFKLHHVYSKLLENYLWKDFDDSKEQNVDSLQGSFMLIRRDLIKKLGDKIFDERYFIWFEDVDLCREAVQKGFEVRYTPVVNCLDYAGKSFAKQPLLWKQRVLTRSMSWYFRKWEPFYIWVWFYLLRPFVVVASWYHDLFFGV